MKKKINLVLVLMILFAQVLFAQTNDLLRVYDGNLYLKINTKCSQKELDSLLRNLNMGKINIGSLQNGQLDTLYLQDGWRIHKTSKAYIELIKTLEQAQHMIDFSSGMHDEKSFSNVQSFYPDANYGFNEFKSKITVQELQNSSKTRFILYGNAKAKNIYLSGSFNKWSTLQHPMIKTDSGWYVDISLGAGKHLYKFIVDGKWIDDPENKNRESDTYYGFNSIFFKTNYKFKLANHQNAKRVVVSGTFNDWNEKEIQLRRTADAWELPMYIKEGTYAYKFLVDKNWILDPANKNTRGDGRGNVNSIFSIGDTLYFKLANYQNSNQVFVSGDFNAWNPYELKMQKNKGAWELPYVLAPGNYFYKFIVDGEWILDPQNPLSSSYENETNSILVVQPNYTFKLRSFENAKDVRVTGSFANWTEPGFQMKRVNGQWQVDVHLAPGKHTYKFIIDGVWTVDPENANFEQNEHQTGNSFVWID